MKYELLEDWQYWDGNGISDLPGKNVTLKADGSVGCIIIDNDGICLYSKSLDNEDDLGERFITMSETADEAEEHLSYILIPEVIAEAKIMYQRYMATQNYN